MFTHSTVVFTPTRLLSQRLLVGRHNALEFTRDSDPGDEWRVHFHIPLHAEPALPLASTRDHLEAVLDFVASDPDLFSHFEMETYTWEVMPDSMRQGSVVDQLAAEYAWTLEALRKRGIHLATAD